MDLNSDVLYHDKPEKLEAISDKSQFDSKYLVGIRHGTEEVLNGIYKEYFPKIKSLVLKNSGNLEDSRDIFQETLIIIYRKSQDPSFELTCRFETYLYAIARNLWFLTLRKRKKYVVDLESLSLTEDIYDLEETILSAERYALYVKTFDTIGEQCKKLLLMYMQGVSMKNIADALGFRSESYAKKRKFKCKEILISKITEDSDYKRIMIRG